MIGRSLVNALCRFGGWRFACVLGLLLCRPVDATQLTPETARFHSVGVAAGLSQPSVKAIAQDRNGFLWFGTQTGLNRWDGFEMRVYHRQHGVADSLAENSINALRVDTHGVLWVGTDGGGLCRQIADSERFQCFAHDQDDPASLPDNTINALWLDRHGRLWVGTEAGLARWDDAGQGFVPAFPVEPKIDRRIRAIAEDGSGQLWLGTPSALLHYAPAADGGVAEPRVRLAVAQGVRALLFDDAQRLWIGTGGAGLWRIDAGGSEPRRWTAAPAGTPGLGSNIIGALLQDHARRLWIGHENGVDLLADPDAATEQFVRFTHQRNNPYGLGAGRIASLFEDASSGLWFGTWVGGASRLRPAQRGLLSYTPDTPGTTGMREPDVTALAAQEPHTLWLGTRAGLYAFDLVERRLREFPATREGRFIHIEPLGERVLLATDRELQWLDPASGAIERVPLPDAVRTQIAVVYLDGERIWLGTREPALHVLDARSFALQASHPLDGMARFIRPLDERYMLIGTMHNLSWFRRDGSAFVHAHVADPDDPAALRSSRASAFLRAHDGRLWLATAAGGLHRLDLDASGEPARARFVSFSRNAGPVADTISGVHEDRRGRLWLSSSAGIVRFDPERAEFTSFLPGEGSLETGYYANVQTQFASGLIAFGGLQGFTLIDPDTVAEPPPPPVPLLTELRLDERAVVAEPAQADALLRQPLADTARLELPAGSARRLALRFTAPDFARGPQLRFAFRLDGFDREWVQPRSGRREAIYTNLPPGEYRFRLATLGPSGMRSAEARALSISVLPYWWQTRWAQALGVLALLGLGLAFHIWRLQRIRAQRRALHRLVNQRTAELSASNKALSGALEQLRRTQREMVEQEKMASLGSLVAGVAHEINTPLGIAVTAASHVNDAARDLDRKTQSGRLTRSELGTLTETLKEASRLVVDSLSRASALVASFKQVAVDQSSEQRRQFKLDEFLEDARLTLEPKYRRTRHQLSIDCPAGIAVDTYPGALFQVLAQLVGNSLLHGFAEDQAGQMRIEVRREGERVRLVYRDDGVGMPPEVAAHAFDPFVTTRRGCGGTGLGLHVVYNLANRLLGGQIELHTAPGCGCTFTLQFPAVAPQREAAQTKPAVRA